jgi:RHS repeat-associated protein
MITRKFWLISVATVAIAALCSQRTSAQVGNDNPTGPSGGFNGSVTTGCSYDPYTGNARRTITDIVVPGSVGAYPLAFTRVANSRGDAVYSSNNQFGEGGNWRHSYAWFLNSTFGLGQPTEYDVDFPDGRHVVFTPSSSDSCFRAAAGVRERFLPLDLNTMLAYLLLPDGGKVEFTASAFYSGNVNGYNFQATAIIDPYGQRTSMTYNWDGGLNTIQEPGGRWLQITYQNDPWKQYSFSFEYNIDHVQSSDGRIVQYHYNGGRFVSGGPQYTWLTSVVYPADPGMPAPTAYYSYQASNVPGDDGSYHGIPLLASCDDPMYEGPMKRISYTYATGQNPDGSPVAAGQIRSENSGATGQAVSTLVVDSTVTETRTEIRGDGPSRTFQYDGGKLVSYSDFKGQYSSISYDGNGYTSAFTDADGHTTNFLREGTIGAMSVLTHPDQSIQGYAYWYSNGGPYYVQIRGDERGHNTYFTRDGNFRLTRVDYPDYPYGAYEEFAYNGFGQVTSHRMTSGGMETFSYDGRGMMYASSNPDGTTYYYYDGYDRLDHVTDARWNATWFQYNIRGQITRITHQDGSYTQNSYNADGTLATSTDELGHTTSYSYDDYKRVVYITNPLQQTTSFVYAQDWANPYVQTTSNPKGVFSPMGKQIHYAYDENWQRTIMRVPSGSDPNDAWIFYGYDPAGNLAWTVDPRGTSTNFGYDNRNRRTSMTVNGLNQTTTWQFDTMGNLTRETRPDQSYRRMEYDSMNRVIDTYGFAGEHTHYDRDLAGNVHQLVDAKGAGYVFYYDAMNRKASAWYPPDATGATRYEVWYRDAVGHIYRHDNPAGDVQILQYDNRDRMSHSYWWGNVGPDVTTQYDAANRATNITTNGGETTVTFGYDDANRQTWEEQTLAGYPTRRVEFWRDADGNRTGLHFPGWYLIRYDYNQRNQLAHIYGGSWEPWFNYSYDAGGNVTQIQDQMGGIIDSMNCPSIQYDPLNRPVEWEQRGGSDNVFARSWQQYDSVGRMAATWRDEQSSKGERFSYTANDQLSVVEYNADQVWTGNPQNWNRWVGYNYTADLLNRQSVNDNGTPTNYTISPLNQYTTVNGATFNYDANFNLREAPNWGGSFDAQNRLMSAGHDGNSVYFTYDGLGRCVRRIAYPPGGGASTVLYAYDGWKPTVEWDGDGNFQAWNIYGGDADEILWRYQANAGHLRYHLDVRGNVAFILDGNGNGLEKYTYDAFGNATVTNWDGTNPRGYSNYGNRFMFQGREWLSELGIYDFRNRMYDPSIGRFLQMDPLGFDGGDTNLFRYCGDDPVNGSDPTGLHDLGDQAEIDLWNSATTEGVVVEGNPVYDILFAENPFADPTRFTQAGLFDRWSNASLNDYYKNSTYDFGLRESSADSQFTSGSVPANGSVSPTAQSSNPLAALLKVIGDMTYTVSFEHHLHTFWIRAGRVPIPLPFGVHAFATIDKKGYTLGIGPGLVEGKGLAGMTGRPFGESSGVQLVSQAVYTRGNWGVYMAGVPWSSAGDASFEYGGAYGLGAGVSITLEATYRRDWPWAH